MAFAHSLRISIFGAALTALASLGAFSGPAHAQAKTQEPSHSARETQQDIQRHRAMAVAHESAAKCLEAGKKEDVCEEELQIACKGLAIGKYCGMKHVH